MPLDKTMAVYGTGGTNSTNASIGRDGCICFRKVEGVIADGNGAAAVEDNTGVVSGSGVTAVSWLATKKARLARRACLWETEVGFAGSK